MEMKSDDILNTRSVMENHFLSHESEFAHVYTNFVEMYSRSHLKINSVLTRYKKCCAQIDLLFYVFNHPGSSGSC